MEKYQHPFKVGDHVAAYIPCRLGETFILRGYIKSINEQYLVQLDLYNLWHKYSSFSQEHKAKVNELLNKEYRNTSFHINSLRKIEDEYPEFDLLGYLPSKEL